MRAERFASVPASPSPMFRAASASGPRTSSPRCSPGCLLIVPTAYTVCSSIAVLATIAVGASGWTRQARQSFPWVAAFVVPAAIFLAA